MTKDGIILINKEQNWTSFDVVAKIRGLINKNRSSWPGSKKVGHGGTLDPMATGLLPIFIGKATKKVALFSNADKGYRGEMLFGIKTDTQDIWGKTTYTHDKKIDITLEKLNRIAKKYIGEIRQTPPMYSAKKKNGVPLYKLARKGLSVKRETKKVNIYGIKFTNLVEADHPRVKFEVTCSKGTYIRALVSDIGDDLGCGACLAHLERFYFYPFILSQAVSVQTVADLTKIGQLDTIIFDADDFIEKNEGINR